MPPPPPMENRHSQYGFPPYGGYGPTRKGFRRGPHSVLEPPERPLGVVILEGLRLTRGGIYYTKSNPFKEVHYVDHFIIYVCQLVPPHLIPINERKCLNTEVGKGLVRGEALDLLGYSYTETDAGKFSISGDLELVCERSFRGGPSSLADFCVTRAKSKSSSTFPIRPSIGN